MTDFIITTDYTCDLTETFCEDNGVPKLLMPFDINSVEYDIRNKFISYPDFYQSMRDGAIVKTSQVSQFDAIEIFSKILESGKDVLHLSFSSGVSSSYANFEPTVKELKEKYPNNKVIVIDTLAGSAGLGLIVYYALKMKNNGKSLEEVVDYIEKEKLTFNHYFIVDDLQNLKRGGRLSALEASFGTLLGIKPVLSLGTTGKISAVGKVRGRKKAYSIMIEKVIEEIEIEKNDFVAICHADNEEWAHEVGDKIAEKLNIEIKYDNLTYLVGGHAGPDTVAVFFIGKERTNNSDI